MWNAAYSLWFSVYRESFFPETFFIELLAYVLYTLIVLILQSGSYKNLFFTFKYKNK